MKKVLVIAVMLTVMLCVGAPAHAAKHAVGKAREPHASSIWDGIPLGDFAISLVVAALIGAAGGRIYAGIVGPRR
jgi:hypothetical protein